MSRHTWRGSSRRYPCPVCGRNSDSKCRRHPGAIACHRGDTFHPPAGLKRGDVFTIEGSPWVVVDLAGGFSGNAVIFKPHIGRSHFPRASVHTPVLHRAVMGPALKTAFAKARHYTQVCLGAPDPLHIPLQELTAELAHARSTAQNLAALRGPLLQARGVLPEMGRYLQAIELWERLVGYQLQELEVFDRVHLGTPSPLQIAELERDP